MGVLLLFVLATAMIGVASELFTNAVEWLGYRLGLGAGATGSLLAAIGTALPETVVPIVALVAGAQNAVSVATGAVLGAPLLLLTLGVAITGVAITVRRSAPRLEIATGQARRDLGFFVGAFALVLFGMAVPSPLHLPLAICLLGIYAVYVMLTLRDNQAGEDMPEPLHLLHWHHRGVDPHVSIVALQLLIAIGGLVWGSDLFVDALDDTSRSLGINALVLAIVVIPFATELPETLNSVLWIRTHDDGLAFGNVAGSATFQACILGFVGLALTPWHPGRSGALSAGLTLATAVLLLALIGPRGRARGVVMVLACLPWIAFVLAEWLAGASLAGS